MMKYLIQSLEEYYSQLIENIYANIYLKTLIILALNKLEKYLEKIYQLAIWLAFFVFNLKYK